MQSFVTQYLNESWQGFERLYKTVGKKFFLLFVLFEHVLQAFIFGGGSGGFIGVPILFLFRQYGTLTASQIQILRTIAISPWAMKPLFGIISDLFTIAGYQKMPHMFLVTCGAIVSSIVLPLSWPVSPIVATVLFFFFFLQIANCDLLLEAACTEKMRLDPTLKTDLVTVRDLGTYIFFLCSILLIGPLIDYMPLQYIYALVLPVFLFTLYPIYNNWIGEVPFDTRNMNLPLINMSGSYCWMKDSDQPFLGFDYTKLHSHRKVFLTAFLVAFLSIITSAVGLFTQNTTVLFIFSLISGPVMIAAFFLLMERQIAAIQSYIILQNMFSVSMESAAFFFYTDTAVQYPEGPHFSNFFYVTVLGIFTCALGLFGVIMYKLFMTEWRYRSVLFVTNGLAILFSGLNIIFYLRWNLILGIPDTIFLLGADAIQGVVAQWASMPLSVAMFDLCPPGLSATVYALMAGSANLGVAHSQYQGAFLLDVFNITPTGATGESAAFANMWKMGLISSLLPIVPLCFTYLLLPDMKQTERILPEKTEQVCTSDGTLVEFEMESFSLAEDSM